MKLAILRSDAERDYFPVFISNSGRSHDDARRTAKAVSDEWKVCISYRPDKDSYQGIFYLDASNLTDLEVEGLSLIIAKKLEYFPVVYDLVNPWVGS